MSVTRSFQRLAAAVGLLSLTAASCSKEKPSTSNEGSVASDVGGAATEPVATAGEPSQAEELSRGPVKLGIWAQAANYRMRATTVKNCVPKPWMRLEKGRQRLGIEVEIAGQGPPRVPANPHYARLTARGGGVYRSVFGGCDPDLRHKPLGTGETARGWITFELPEDSRDLLLSYSPYLVDGGKQTLEFDLGR